MNFVVSAIVFCMDDSLFKNHIYSFGWEFAEGDKSEFVFWIMVYIFYDMNWREMYSKKFSKLFMMLESFEKRLEKNELGFLVSEMKKNGF